MNINNTYTYVISETKKYESLDPLNGDLAHNLPVQRMIYLTPLEVSSADKLSSHILESFSYNKNTRTIHWKVKQGVKYSDGTEVTANDVTLSIARMLLKRPQFPVIQDIKGASSWLKKETPLSSLPEGIKVTGQDITIELEKSYKNPLFRFCLEIFSIIPSSCVDLKTNQVSCEKIPTNGYYEVSVEAENSVSFKLKSTYAKMMKDAPRDITFKYIEPKNISDNLEEFDEKTVLAGSHYNITYDKLNKFKKLNGFKSQPASRFLVLLLNPKNEAFKDKKCRRVFADLFREAYAKEYDREKVGSVFTKITKGYSSFTDLAKNSTPIELAEKNSCIEKIKSSAPKWGYIKKSKNNKFLKTLNNTMEGIGLESNSVEVDKANEFVDKYLKDDFSISNGTTGFWAMDPAGDVKMLFTPNMHKMLSQVAGDEKLQRLINEANDPSVMGEDANIKINQHLFDQAIFNVYAHISRFYVSKNKDLINDVLIGITSPAPWQVFKVRN